jgi:hypothetical protein
MFAIADEFVEDGGDEAECFCAVESDAAGEAALGEEAGLGDYQLVYLFGEDMKLDVHVLRAGMNVLVSG